MCIWEKKQYIQGSVIPMASGIFIFFSSMNGEEGDSTIFCLIHAIYFLFKIGKYKLINIISERENMD
jgi:hypothetical protein